MLDNNTKITSFEELKSLYKKINKSLDKQATKVLVCAGTGCIANGSIEVYETLRNLVEEKGLLINIDFIHENDEENSSENNCARSSVKGTNTLL